MKVAIEDDNGTVTTFGTVKDFTFNYHRGRLESVDFAPRPDQPRSHRCFDEFLRPAKASLSL